MAVYSEVIDTQRQSKVRERMFYSSMAIVIAIVILVGFSRTFYLRPYFHSERLHSIADSARHGFQFVARIVCNSDDARGDETDANSHEIRCGRRRSGSVDD